MRIPDRDALRRLVWIVVLLALVWSALLVLAAAFLGGESLLRRIGAIGTPLALATLGIFALNHLLRFVRWHLMLRAEGHVLPWARSLSIFLAGLALLPTPAKAGVAARSLLLIAHGVPVHVSLAAYLCERLLDLLGLVVLATLLLPSGEPYLRVLLALGVGILGMVVIAGAPTLCRAARGRVTRWPAAVSMLDWLAQFLADAAHMISGWRLPAFLVLGLLANAATGGLLWVALRPEAGVELAAATGILAVSHLSGSVSLLPGGLGGFELAMLAQLGAFAVPPGEALLALTLVRITTLWGSVAVGIPLLIAGLRRLPMTER